MTFSTLNHAPVGVIMLVVCLLSLLVMFAIHWVVHLYIDKFIPGTKPDFAMNVHTSLITFLGALLAFSLVQAVGNFKMVDSIVRQESVRINNLDRLLVRYGDSKLESVRSALRVYATSIVEDDWPEMIEARYSRKTEALFKDVSKGIIEIKPTTPRENSLYADMLKLTDSLADSRGDRIEAADVGIPDIFWIALALLFFFKSILSGFADRTQSHNIVLSVQIMALACLFCVTYIFDAPFMGEVAVKPTAISEVIKIISERTN